MKQYIFSIVFFITSLAINAEALNGSITNVTSGGDKPCPGSVYTYKCTASNSKGLKITVSLSQGRFQSGGRSKDFYLSNGVTSFNIDVIWDDITDEGLIAMRAPELDPNGDIRKRVSIQSLYRKVPDITKSKGNGTITYNQTIVDPPITGSIPGNIYGKTTIEIPKGQTGSCTLKATLSYPGGTKVSKFKWVVNGKEDTSNTSDTYVLNHDELNNDGTTIVVTGLNNLCGTNLISSPTRTITFSRKGIDGKDTENVSGNITVSKFIKAKSTVNITNTTISNNANVTVIAGKTIVITPNTMFTQGTTVRVWATGDAASTRSEIYIPEIEEDDLIEEEFDTNYYDSYYEGPLTIQEQVLLESCDILLYPNPTEGLLTFDCPYVQTSCQVSIYNTSGSLVYTNHQMYSGETIDLSANPKGIYLARIVVDGEVKTQKILLK